jgi:septal ring-binding cell division protein DamX
MSDTNPLLSNATIQGAAKHIEGLMDTKGVIKEPQKEEAPVQPAEEAKAETEVEQKPVAQQEETQEAPVEEEASEDSNAKDEQETDLHQVIVNGEKIDVDLEELVR